MMVQDQLHDFLKANLMLKKNQFAFRTLYSMIIFLLNSTEHWRHNADNQMLNMTVFLDLITPFDTVDHRILIDRLMMYGVNGKGHEWFKSYLCGRKQFYFIISLPHYVVVRETVPHVHNPVVLFMAVT